MTIQTRRLNSAIRALVSKQSASITPSKGSSTDSIIITKCQPRDEIKPIVSREGILCPYCSRLLLSQTTYRAHRKRCMPTNSNVNLSPQIKASENPNPQNTV